MVNWRIRGFVFWCHEQVIRLCSKLTSNDISNDLNDVLIYHIGKLIWYCTDPCYVFIHFTPIYCRQKSFFSCQFYFCTIGFMTKASRKGQKNITDDKKRFFFCHIAFFFLMTYYFDLTKQKSSNACEIRVQADPEEPSIWHYIHFDEICVCSRCNFYGQSFFRILFGYWACRMIYHRAAMVDFWQARTP